MIAAVNNPDLKIYEGKTVAEMAKMESKPEMDALFDFILADKGQTEALYFMANENDLRYGLKQPWTSIGLDAGETSLDGPLFEPHTHPRAWGSMPRFLGHYTRDLQLLDLPQAIRKGIESAKKNLFKINLTATTIPHAVLGRYGSGQVLLDGEVLDLGMASDSNPALP